MVFATVIVLEHIPTNLPAFALLVITSAVVYEFEIDTGAVDAPSSPPMPDAALADALDTEHVV